MKKVVIIGPESTGKSTLTQGLAKYFNSPFVNEYAREYLLENGKDYTYTDFLNIAIGQIELENSAIKACAAKEKFIFIDTDSYVLKVWSEYVYNKCESFILNNIATRKYDLYLLCNTDLPWQKDELREYPDLETRMKLFNYYKDAMINQNTPWAEISGNENLRFEGAIAAIKEYLID
ncbi:MAG: AAA family ATPase [Bacteroidetes bacterium]|nr:AAA family ATPase [Bacteroidota bacterium]